MPIRCLAFTTTHRRPHMAVCCVLQMRSQTFPVRHVVRVAADTEDTNYVSLLERWAAPQTRIVSGPNRTQHANYVDALTAEPDFERFDLFIKIDDDDFYYPDYVLNVVEDWKRQRWNVSSTSSHGVVNGGRLRTDGLRTLGAIPEEGTNPQFEMPATLAFDGKALSCIRSIGTVSEFEDRAWRRAWLEAGLDVAVRRQSDYLYHVHGGNCSTRHWFDPT